MLSPSLRTTTRYISTLPVVKVLSLDARDTLIRMKENPGVVYSRFAKKSGLDIAPDDILKIFLKNYKRMSFTSPCFGCNQMGNRLWWKEVVVSTLLDCSPESNKERVEQVSDSLYDFYATADPWMLVEDDLMDLFRKPKKRNVATQLIRKKDSSSDDEAETDLKDVIKKRRRSNPMVQSTRKIETERKDSSDESDNEDIAVATHSFAATGEAGPSGPLDQGATATLEVDTDYSRDSQAQFERVQQQLKEGVEKDGKVLYKGSALYGAKEAKDTAKGNASSGYNRVGPVRAPQFLRQTVRWDFAPDICKDYKETGFCTFGDSCKFVHDRSDYKHGWEIDEEYEAGKYGAEDDADYEIREDDTFPEDCFICGNPFIDPIVTKCKHYFCSGCALKAFQKSSKCPVCHQNTEKIMNAAKDLINYIKRKKQKQTEKTDEKESDDDHDYGHDRCDGNHDDHLSEEREEPGGDTNKSDVSANGQSDGEQEILMEDVEGLEGGENLSESDGDESDN